VYGGSGSDLIFGGGGGERHDLRWQRADTIDGGSGHNQIFAGTGGTLIQDSGVRGQDTVVGFNQAHGDGISFAGEDAGTIANVVAIANVSGGSTVITLPDGSTMTLLGITHIDSTISTDRRSTPASGGAQMIERRTCGARLLWGE
jgi:serralysin